MELVMIDETGRVSEEECRFVKGIVAFAAEQLELSGEVELSVTFMNDAQIREVNRTYRGKDTPTDVISFALQDEGEEELPIVFAEGEESGFPRNLGDMMISVERAKAQAEEYGHSYQRELGFLAVHGFLHLNGYDHLDPEEEKEMFALQKEILEAYGLTREESKEI